MQTAFNGGELSRYMRGRPDHAIWAVGLAACVGFAPRPQGPLEACPGFEFVANASGAGRLIPFEPRLTQGYVIEATDELFRFFTNDVLLQDEGEPVTVESPYLEADIPALDYEPSEDVLYLWHRGYRSRQLVRNSASSFSLSELDFENGPFGNRNDDEAHRLSFSGVIGSVTVTSTKDVFAATDVGRLIEVEANDLGDVPSWEPGVTTTLNSVLQWDGRVYQVIGGRLIDGGYRTGTVSPVHTRGTEWDGIGAGQDINDNPQGGVQLQYMHDMFGRARITAFTDARTVTATVTRRLPLQTATAYALNDYGYDWWTPDAGYIGTNPWAGPAATSYTAGTWRWRLGAFSDTTGWPEHGVVWNQRLYLSKDNVIYASVAGSLTDFDRLNEFGEVSLDQAFTIVLDHPLPVRWMLAEDELFFGTGAIEWVLRQSSTAEGIGPGNVQVSRQTREGAKLGTKPIPMNGRPIFLQRSGRALLQMVEETVGRYSAEDLTRYADHIGKAGFTELAFQKRPLRLLWGVLDDGSLAGATYMADEGVLGWFPRPLAPGLKAESIATITASDGRDEQLWLRALHEPSGARFVMAMDEWRRAEDSPANPVMCDAALRATSDTAFSTITLSHLPNTSVDVVADGQWLGAIMTDANGQIALDEPANSAMAGLAYDAYFTFLEPEAGGDNGPAQQKMKRNFRTGLRLEKARALEVVNQAGIAVPIQHQAGGDALADAPEEISGDVLLDHIGAWDREGQVTIRRYAPYQSTILAAMHTIEVAQR